MVLEIKSVLHDGAMAYREWLQLRKSRRPSWKQYAFSPSGAVPRQELLKHVELRRKIWSRRPSEDERRYDQTASRCLPILAPLFKIPFPKSDVRSALDKCIICDTMVVEGKTMSKTLAVKNDFLGVVAIGSVIGNLVQANGMVEIKRQRNTLVGLYRNLVARYKMLLQEYQTFRQVNADLQKQVVALREENNKLQERMAAKEPVK